MATKKRKFKKRDVNRPRRMTGVPYIIEPGTRFGDWEVIKFVGIIGKHGFHLCKCLICKKEFQVGTASLDYGKSRRCDPCRRKLLVQRMTTHGKRQSRAYQSWFDMKQRCYNQKSHVYSYYGGRGITVCDRWRESFENFYADMGDPPPKTSIDRIDNNGNYCKENCRWSDRVEQSNNTRRNRRLQYNGEEHTLAEWSRITGLAHHVIWYRLRRGWSVEDALTRRLGKPTARMICFKGSTRTIVEWGKITGIPMGLIHHRLYKGWSIEEALLTPQDHRRKNFSEIWYLQRSSLLLSEKPAE